MSKEEYLKLKGCSSVDELTDKEVEEYFLKGYMGFSSQMSVERVVNERKTGLFNMDDAIKFMRQALEEEKDFVCHYIMGEGVVEKDEDLERIGTSHFEYEVR
jgi:hypothetical protein